jgi:hypothetical protein
LVTFVVGIGGRDFTAKDVSKLVEVARRSQVNYAWYVGGEVREGF